MNIIKSDIMKILIFSPNFTENKFCIIGLQFGDTALGVILDLKW